MAVALPSDQGPQGRFRPLFKVTVRSVCMTVRPLRPGAGGSWNLSPVPLTAFEKTLLKRRSLIETVFDELKNLCQIEHTRHHSSNNFIANLMQVTL